MAGALYLELLSERDLALLVRAGAGDASTVPALRARPERIEELLASPRAYEALFKKGDPDVLAGMSPFLAFAVVVARTSADLRERPYLEEWTGPGERVPVFDVAAARDFVGDASRRIFLAELLASYTRVTSGSVLMRSGRGWRRLRYSDLDPTRLADLLEVATSRERPAIYRRLGDLALFLSGVFPDHVGTMTLAPRDIRRLASLLGPRSGDAGAAGLAGVAAEALGRLEWIGRRSYRAAHEASGAGATVRVASASGDASSLLADVAERFSEARRILNFLTDRYLFPVRERWFRAEG